MFTLFRNLIGYVSSQYNYDQYILYGAIVIAILFFVVLIDLVYKMMRSFVRK